MARWEPDARGRMVRAALDLYTEQGFEQTTTAQIAKRAGVTERTYFRHFADKREVLFDGSAQLETALADAVAGAPADAAPLDVVAAAFAAMSASFGDQRDFSLRRAAAIAAAPRLQERELLKLSALRDAAAAALRERGTPEPAASMVAEAGVAAFRVGYETWVATEPPPSLANCILGAMDALRGQGAP